MCGIAGIVSSDVPDRRLLERMAQALRHRGPDDFGVAVTGNVGLAHARLAIVGLGLEGCQPMRHPTGMWLNFNGEIFDHLALREQLPARMYAGQSDSETLLHALATRGLDVVRELNGFFAFALLDPARGRLLLVRDRMGIKPLYWVRHARSLVFASEIKGLFAAGVPARPALDALRFTAAWTWAQGRCTPFDGIERLLPGRYLEVDIDSLAVHERTWYRLSDSVDARYADELATLSLPEARDRLELALRRSVGRRLSGEVPVATLCSGGIDSGTITALAALERPGLAAYVASIPDQPSRDESGWAESVCRRAGVTLRIVPMGRAAWRRHFVASAAHFEYPLWHESSVALAAIAEVAASDGVKVLLGGEGADELLGGYDYKHTAARSAFATAAGVASTAPLSDPRLWVEDWSLANLFDSPPKLASDEQLRSEIAENLASAYAHHEPPRRLLEATLAAELHLFLAPALCRVDKNVMQFGVEYREPFLDTDVVRLALNLPLEHRVLPSVKALLREVAAKHLPHAVLARPKLGFSFDAFTYLAPLRPDFLLSSRIPDLLSIARDRWVAAVESARGRTLFRLVALATWCRLFGDSASSEEVANELWNPD